MNEDRHLTAMGQAAQASRGNPMRGKNPRVTTAIVLGAAAAVLSIPVLRHPGAGFPYPLGFESGITGSPAGWIMAFVVAIVFIVFTVKNIPMVARSWREVSILKALSIYAAIVAAIVEEAFFRRIIMDMVAHAGGNVWVQVAASAVTFGVAHAVWGLIKLDVQVAVKSSIATGAMGAALAVVYVTAGRSLAPCIVSHFLITAALEPGLMVAAVSGQLRRGRLQSAGQEGRGGGER